MADMEFYSVTEKAAYLRGLAEGLDLDKSKPEGKLIDAMLDLIYDMADELMAQDDAISELYDEIVDDDDYDIDDEYFDEDYYDDDNPDYEVKCPECGAEVIVDEDTLMEGEILCPNCGTEMEFDFSEIFGDEAAPDCSSCKAKDLEDIPF